MKPLTRLAGPALLLGAGLVLGAIALRAEDPTYVPPARAALPERVPHSLEAPPPAGHVAVTLDVAGICCSGCGAKLYAALTAVPEVAAAAVDPVLARAEAVVPAGFDPARLEAALTFDKYTAQRLE